VVIPQRTSPFPRYYRDYRGITAIPHPCQSLLLNSSIFDTQCRPVRSIEDYLRDASTQNRTDSSGTLCQAIVGDRGGARPKRVGCPVDTVKRCRCDGPATAGTKGWSVGRWFDSVLGKGMGRGCTPSADFCFNFFSKCVTCVFERKWGGQCYVRWY